MGLGWVVGWVVGRVVGRVEVRLVVGGGRRMAVTMRGQSVVRDWLAARRPALTLLSRVNSIHIQAITAMVPNTLPAMPETFLTVGLEENKMLDINAAVTTAIPRMMVEINIRWKRVRVADTSSISST